MRFALPCLLILLTACTEDPCGIARTSTPFGTGDADLVFDLVEEDGDYTTRPRAMSCVDVLVLASGAYADTLASGRFLVVDNQVRLDDIPAVPADVIVDVPGFFPAKFPDVRLTPGMNVLPDKVLMFQTDVNIVLPGHVGVTLRAYADTAHLRDLYSPFGRVRMQAAPGNYYELKLPFRGTRGTRRDVEALLGKLVRSQHVVSARPLVTVTAALR